MFFAVLSSLKSVVELSNVQIILSSNSIAGTISFFFIGLFKVSIYFTYVDLTQMNTGLQWSYGCPTAFLTSFLLLVLLLLFDYRAMLL